jgi:predicted site-specific integrase-resolvase
MKASERATVERFAAEYGRFLTPGEVARMFRVDPTTVARWSTGGRLPCLVLPGNLRRYREADVTALLNEASR